MKIIKKRMMRMRLIHNTLSDFRMQKININKSWSRLFNCISREFLKIFLE